jgi:DNA-directed RNA polymerase specialized sigma24 family protein
MSGDSGATAAQLSSLATALDELTRRVTALAESHAGSPDDGLAQDLYKVERALVEAHRRLARTADKMTP